MSAYLIAEERRKMEVSCIVSSLIRFHCLCLVNDDVSQPYQGTHISTISQPDVKCGSFIFFVHRILSSQNKETSKQG